MQSFVAIAVLVSVATAYLLHQFWSRALSTDRPDSPDLDGNEAGSEDLRAA